MKVGLGDESQTMSSSSSTSVHQICWSVGSLPLRSELESSEEVGV